MIWNQAWFRFKRGLEKDLRTLDVGEPAMTLDTKKVFVGTGTENIELMKRITSTNAPTSGTWVRGDFVYNSAPSPGGYLGWVCTAGGSPGTWKGFGLIQQ